MDISTLAAWGEFLGGIAVVVSLIYLAGQIRQNSRLLQVSTTAAVGESEHAIISALLQDSELRRIWSVGWVEFESLSEAERAHFSVFLSLLFSVFYRNYYFAKDGTIRGAVWEGEKRATSFVLRQAWARHCWSELRFSFSDEFGDFVDGLIHEIEAAE